MESSTRQGKSPVAEVVEVRLVSRVPQDTRNPVGRRGDHPPKAKYYLVTDREQYREGKVKRTPGGE